jgi:hypothetical protein
MKGDKPILRQPAPMFAIADAGIVVWITASNPPPIDLVGNVARARGRGHITLHHCFRM